VLALLAGVACIAESSIVFKHFPKSDPLVTNAISLSVGAPFLAVLSRLAGEPWALPSTPRAWGAVGYLVLIGSVVVFYLYLRILSRWTATTASYAFLLMPVATVLIAAWLLGEAITLPFLIGAALVLAGVWVGAFRSAPQAAELTCAEMPSKAMC
jgi:drug/metabolite transporter (DMT)-like permease